MGGRGRLPPAVIDSIRPIEYPPPPLWIPPLERKPTTTLESAIPTSTKRVRSHFPSGISLSLSAVDIDPFQKGVSERNWTRGRGINFDSERRVYRVDIGFAGTILGEKLCFNPFYLSREYVTLTLLPFLEVIRQIYWNWRFVSPLVNLYVDSKNKGIAFNLLLDASN